MRNRLGPILMLLLAGCPGTQGHAGRLPPMKLAVVQPFALGRSDLVLLITGGTQGMLETCNCAGPTPGGLARRGGLLASYRAAFGRTFLLDSGDLFWVEPLDLRNDFILHGYRRLGYDAVALGNQEWSAGADRLRGLLAGEDLPFLSSNIELSGGGPPLPVRREIIRQWPGLRLAVLSYCPREAFFLSPAAAVAQLSFGRLEDLAARVGELKRQGCLVVLAVHGDEKALQAAASAVPADLIVRGDTARSDEDLQRVDGKPAVKVGGYETVGVVAIQLAPDGGAARMEYRLEVVDDRWPADEALMEVYQAYAHAAMRKALDAQRRQGLSYVSSSQCGRCHGPQYEAWRRSPHARAYRSLLKVRRAGDPNCLMCHVSGFGTTEGFYTADKTPQLAGVNCQDCHRFNDAEHRRKDFASPRAGEELCTTCHTPVTDPTFDFRADLPKVRCPP